MSQARNDTAEARLDDDAAQGAASSAAGRHRGPSSPDDNETPAHGRHRRPATG